MVYALGHPSTSLDVDADHLGRGSPPTDEPVCPDLLSLEFEGVSCQPGLMESLLGVLSRRRWCSFPVLEKLSLELSCDGTDGRECEISLDLYAEGLSNFAVEADIYSV